MPANRKNLFNLIKAATDELPVEQQFIADLKAGIEKEEAAANNGRLPSQTYNPSGLSCIRSMWYKITGTNPDEGSTMGAEIIGVCQVGTDRHERLQTVISSLKSHGINCDFIPPTTFKAIRNLDYLKFMGVSGNETHFIDTRFNLSFKSDGIIKYKNIYYILEIKTEKSSKFWEHKDVRDEHILQGTCYSISYGIDQIMYLYEERDMLNKKAFVLQVTPEMKEKVTDKIEQCDQFRKDNILPPKPLEACPKFCQYCNYRKKCEVNACQ